MNVLPFVVVLLYALIVDGSRIPEFQKSVHGRSIVSRRNPSLLTRKDHYNRENRESENLRFKRSQSDDNLDDIFKEAASNADDLASDSCCPTGWHAKRDRTTCVKFSTVRLSWYDAARHCQNIHQGQLVSIHNEEDNNMTYGLMPKDNPDVGYWIGAKTTRPAAFDRSRWYWVDGSAMDYENWNAGEPNNGRGHRVQTCMDIFTGKEFGVAGKWDDEVCTTEQLFVCEKPSDNMFCVRPV